MGSKTPTTTTNATSTYTANPAVQSATQGLVGSATALSQNPYQAFTGQMVSPTTAQQQTGYGQVTQAAGIYSPYATSALGSLTNLPQYNASTIQSYMSPYTGQVVQATEQQLQNMDAQQQAQLTGNSISAGAFGGDRAAVASGVLAGQQDIANNATIAGLYQGAFQNAQGELNTQQQTGLQTAGAYGNLGTSALTNALTGAAANVQAGTQQQSTQTAIDQANYQLYQSALAYPYQNASFLSSILSGAGSTLGGTTQGTSTTTQSAPSLLSDITSLLGGAGAVAGALLPKSDERAKENIEPVGKLFDGTIVYKYNLRGHPQTMIGLMAQDVEKKYPEAVIKDPQGIRHLNYDIATEDAAKRKHFDAGGVVIPYGGGAPNGIIPLGSAQVGGINGQQMSEMGLQSLNSGHGGGNPAQTSAPGQIAGLLQNKQSMQGLQAIYQFSGLQNVFQNLGQNIGNDFSLFSDAGPLIPGGLRRGGGIRGFAVGGPIGLTPADMAILASEMAYQGAPSQDGGYQGVLGNADTAMRRGGIVRGFADGGTPYGDLSGVNFDPGLPASSDYDFPLTAPTNTPIAGPSAPPPVPSNIVAPPQSGGITAINSALQSSPSQLDTFDRMITQESGGHQFRPDGTPLVSPKGAVGVAQVEPSTGPEAADAAGLPWDPDRLANDKDYNLALGHAYFQKQLQNFGSPDVAAAAYNAGPQAVKNAVAKAQKEGGQYLDYLPAETQNYVSNVMKSGSSGNGLPGGALAFDGSTPPNGSGLSAPPPPTASAQAPSTGPLSGITQFFSGLVPHVTDAERMGIIGTGLGIMASHSPFPLRQIGEGGLAGLQTYMNASSLQREQALAQSQIAYQQGTLGIEQRKADLLLMNAANIARSLNGGTDTNLPYGAGAGAGAGGGSAPQTSPAPTNGRAVPSTAGAMPPGGASANPVAAPVTSTMGAVPNPPVPNDPSFWTRVAPSSNPAYLDQRASQYERAAIASAIVPEQAEQLSQIAMQYRRTAQQIRTNGQVTMQDGSVATIPGFAQSQAQIAAAQGAGKNLQTPTAAGILLRDPNNPAAPPRLVPWSQVTGGNRSNAPQISAGAPQDTRLFTDEGAKGVAEETGPVLALAAKNGTIAQQTLYRVADMRNELTQLPASGWLAPGTGFHERSDVAKEINTAFSMLGVPDKNLLFDANAVASGQALQKLTRTMGFDLARTLGTREAMQIVNQAIATVPSADNTPLGAKRLLASIEQVSQRQIDWYNYAQQWAAETGGSLLGAAAKFEVVHPPQQYAAKALISTIPPGAVALLRNRPDVAAQFDQKYGPGSSRLVLGAATSGQ